MGAIQDGVRQGERDGVGGEGCGYLKRKRATAWMLNRYEGSTVRVKER